MRIGFWFWRKVAWRHDRAIVNGWRTNRCDATPIGVASSGLQLGRPFSGSSLPESFTPKPLTNDRMID